MKKFVLLTISALILSGCSISSIYSINSDGSVTGVTALSVPKRAVRNVSTLEQWQHLLSQNNLGDATDSPTPEPSGSLSAAPLPTPSCAAGEDTDLREWTYTCTVSGDPLVISAATAVTGSSGLTFDRANSTLTIVQPAFNQDSGADNPLGGLSGISLIYTTTTLSFPGTVTAVAGGAQKVNDNTVTFTADQTQTQEQSATVTLSNFTSQSTSMTLSALPRAAVPNGVDIQLTAALTAPADGDVVFMDGDTTLTQQTIGVDGTAVYVAPYQSGGTHNYKARFIPSNWFKIDSARATTSTVVKAFQITTPPKLLGTGKVGSQLSPASVKSSPAAGSISYQWLRNGKVIAGKTGHKYAVVAADFNKSISVRITLRKTGYLPVVIDSFPLKVTKR